MTATIAAEQVEAALLHVRYLTSGHIGRRIEVEPIIRLAIAQRDERIKELELSLKNVQDQCDFYEGEMYQNEDAAARDANRIAELEAEMKRKDEALNKYASASDVTCTYSNYPNSRSYDVYEHCEKWAQEALAPKKEE